MQESQHLFRTVTLPVMLGKQRACLWRYTHQRVHANSVFMESHGWGAVYGSHTLPEAYFKQTDALVNGYLGYTCEYFNMCFDVYFMWVFNVP